MMEHAPRLSQATVATPPGRPYVWRVRGMCRVSGTRISPVFYTADPNRHRALADAALAFPGLNVDAVMAAAAVVLP
jgi:hypothetical protein